MSSAKGRIVFARKSDPVYYHSVLQPSAAEKRDYEPQPSRIKNIPSHIHPKQTREDVRKKGQIKAQLYESLPKTNFTVPGTPKHVQTLQTISEVKDTLTHSDPHISLEDLQDRVLGKKRDVEDLGQYFERQKANGGLKTPDIYQKTPEQEGETEAEKEAAKERWHSEEKLQNMVSSTQNCLLEIKTVFPFKVFPTKLIIDQEKVNIVETTFFFSDTIRSIWLRSILDVSVECDIFFGKIIIVDVGFRDNPMAVNWLWKEDAYRARRLIQGLIIAHKQNLDLTNLSAGEIYQKLVQLGQVPNE